MWNEWYCPSLVSKAKTPAAPLISPKCRGRHRQQPCNDGKSVMAMRFGLIAHSNLRLVRSLDTTVNFYFRNSMARPLWRSLARNWILGKLQLSRANQYVCCTTNHMASRMLDRRIVSTVSWRVDPEPLAAGTHLSFYKNPGNFDRTLIIKARAEASFHYQQLQLLRVESQPRGNHDDFSGPRYAFTA